MARLGRADKIAIRQLQPGSELLPHHCQFITIGVGCFAFRHGRLLHLLSVLIQAGQEEGLLPQAAAHSRDYIRDHLLVSVPEVRVSVYVINSGSKVKALAHVPVLWRTSRLLATAPCIKSKCYP